MNALFYIAVAALAPIPLVFAIFCSVHANRILKLTSSAVESRYRELETIHERALLGERQRMIRAARRLATELEDERSRVAMQLMLVQLEQRELLS